MTKKRDFFRFFYRIFLSIALFILLTGIVVNTFMSGNGSFLPGNFLVLFLSALLLLLFIWTNRILKKSSLQTNRWILAGLILLFLVFEIYLLKNFIPSLIHDPFRLRSFAYDLARGKQGGWGIYFAQYPQIVPPTIFYSWAVRLGRFFLLDKFAIQSAISFTLLNLFLALCLLNVYQAVKKIRYLNLTMLIFFCLPMLYSYNLWILYTDLPAMITWALAVWLLQLALAEKKLSWKLLTPSALVFYFGMSAKASFVVILPALAVILCFVYFRQKQAFRSVGKLFLLLICVVVLSFPINTGLEKSYGFTSSQRYEFPITHWMSMGLNQTSAGQYNQADVNQMASLPNKTQRSRAAGRLLSNRIRQAGPFGLLRQFVQKFAILLYAGNIFDRYHTGFILASPFYENHAQFVNNVMSILSRASYIAIFSLAFWKLRKRLFDSNYDDTAAVFSLATVTLVLAGLSFYALLWEVNGRYGEIVILPILLLALQPDKDTAVVEETQQSKKALIVLVLLSCISVVFMTLAAYDVELVDSSQQAIDSDPDDVLAKRTYLPVLGNYSNYGSGYDREDEKLLPGQTISQLVHISGHRFTRLRIMREQRQQGQLTIQYQGQTIFQKNVFANKKTWVSIERPFKPGDYRIIWHNNRQKNILVVSQFGHGYPLSIHAVQGSHFSDRYFVYIFESLER